MRILFAGDEHPYSAYALKKVTGLAMNTWADVTLMAVNPTLPSWEWGPPLPADHPLNEALYRYREDFLSGFQNGDSPYALDRPAYEWFPVKEGRWEQVKVCRGKRKDLRIRVRGGNAASEILAEAREEGSDLIVLGCTKGSRCTWEHPPGVPQKVLNDAACSVLLVKEDQAIKKIYACIDETSISQESLEMINQMVSINGADLELIGLMKDGGAKTQSYARLIEVGDYYSDRQVPVKAQLLEISDFESTIAKDSEEVLLALWMGKKSLLNIFFPRDWAGRFVSTCQSSILVLR